MGPDGLPASVAETERLLAGQHYIADRTLATNVHLAMVMTRPLFLEVEPGAETPGCQGDAAACGRIPPGA